MQISRPYQDLVQDAPLFFNSLPFLAFFPAFLLLYFLTNGRVRTWICLIGSYVFYGWWDWRFLTLIGLSTLIDYTLGLRIAGSKDDTVRRRLMIASVFANLLILGTFKYFHFFEDSLAIAAARFGWSLPQLPFDIILPVGISFFTFQTMSYTIDVYRRTCEPEPDLLRFATFVAFFPQLVAGPIVRASQMLPQLREEYEFDWHRACQGVLLIAWGFVLKSVVADSLALVVDVRFENPSVHNGLSNLIGIVFYAFQIYCDFNGYSLIAIGIGKVLGFDFGKNFQRPYFASSFSEFWRRWHISLSTWLRDYLYIPLGGNRKGAIRTQINLAITMLLGGLWHGASWQFVIWGALHGLYLVLQRGLGKLIDRAGLNRAAASWPARSLSILTVFALTCIAWVFFRAATLHDAIEMLSTVADIGGYSAAAVTQKFHVIKGAALIGIVLVAELATEVRPELPRILNTPVAYGIALAAMVWAISLLGTFANQSFIYFQF